MMMKDVFDAKVICKNCNLEMLPVKIGRHGFTLRAVRCPECGEKIVHPGDLKDYREYNALKGKTYNVKLRVVGNSHAISIPKEIVDFINDMNRRMRNHMDDMVKLCFEDFGKISLRFNNAEARRKNGR